MNLKDVINRATVIVGYEGALDYDNPTRELSLLIDSAKMIYSELTLEYIPLKTVEEVSVANGVFYYNALERTPREVLTVYHGSKKLPFTQYADCVKVEGIGDGKVEVKYLFHHPDADVDEALELPPKITAYLLSIGTASEYFYRLGMVDEALFLKTRYENSLTNVMRDLKSVNIPPRRMLW